MIKKMMHISVPVAAADQLIKAYIRCKPQRKTLFEIPGIAAITPSFNTGAAFSLLSGQTVFLAVLSAVLLLVLCVYLNRALHLSRAAQTSLCFLIGGGVGNLIDRIVYGGVTDYIRLLPIDFPIFNLADIAVTGSVAALLMLLFTGRLEKTTGEEHGSNH
ncbi:MAG: signal peptidase II [Candidatus Ventricola sp.]